MMKKVKAKILLIEDDPNLCMVLKDYLEMQSYWTTVCGDGESGLEEFFRNSYDLCIIDIMLPVKDGFTLAAEIREINKNIPIIFLTARSLNQDRIKGFQIGCDDYVTKPFSTDELSLRIAAILKRCLSKSQMGITDTDTIYAIGSYIFDYSNLTIKNDDNLQRLTKKEADLLHLLCINKNKLLSRSVALKTVWGSDDYFIGRSMDVFITKLRKYLKADNKILISNVHGTGFKLEVKE